jgi:nucleoside-diphosphate-sugar epimerase
MNNLIIGKTSQLAYYFPDDYERISSRNINYNQYENKKFDSVYICFAEQRTFIQDNLKMFIDVNVTYTLQVIDFFSKISNRLVVYSTYDLWNKYPGGINLDLKIDCNISNYNLSKRIMAEEIKREKYSNIIIIYPFNFNSPYRKEGFLFSKIFDSIINKKKISIGDTHFYRDLIHPKYVVERSILATEDEIVGSGRLVFVNDFIRDLYNHFDLDYDELVTEDDCYNLNFERNVNYLKTNTPMYNMLLEDTIFDIENIKNNKNV